MLDFCFTLFLAIFTARPRLPLAPSLGRISILSQPIDRPQPRLRPRQRPADKITIHAPRHVDSQTLDTTRLLGHDTRHEHH